MVSARRYSTSSAFLKSKIGVARLSEGCDTFSVSSWKVPFHGDWVGLLGISRWHVNM